MHKTEVMVHWAAVLLFSYRNPLNLTLDYCLGKVSLLCLYMSVFFSVFYIYLLCGMCSSGHRSVASKVDTHNCLECLFMMQHYFSLNFKLLPAETLLDHILQIDPYDKLIVSYIYSNYSFRVMWGSGGSGRQI